MNDIDIEIWGEPIEEVFAKPTLPEKLFLVWTSITAMGGAPIGCLVLFVDLKYNKEPVFTAAVGGLWAALGLYLSHRAHQDFAYRNIDNID